MIVISDTTPILYNNERYQCQSTKLSPNEYYQYITTGIYPLKDIVRVLKETWDQHTISIF